QITFENTPGTAGDSPIRSSRELASILIDADAGTPIYQWNGSASELAWMRGYMDHLPYEIANAEHSLVIGSGGGQDILMSIAGGSDKVTAVEINPMIVSAVRSFGGQAGNVYDRSDVELHIDDGRRFIGSSTSTYDIITIKLVDSWAAQLAGGYALSENYLYTVEAFQQYLRHLDDDESMLAMIRWSFELPRLMPIVEESLARETGKSSAEVSSHVVVVEDRPGLYFGRTDDTQTYYPVLVMVKSAPFTTEQLNLVKERAERNGAELVMLGDTFISPPFDKLFSHDGGYEEYVSSVMGMNPKVTTDDSPFYFAREPVPRQMTILLATVLGISGVLSVLLYLNSRKMGDKNEMAFQDSVGFSGLTDPRSLGFVLFAVFIGLGFMILEITFIQKFLLLLGTPIMALTVILFSILLSGGIGAYLSGRLFGDKPYRAVFVSVPILAGIILSFLFFLQGVIDSNIVMPLQSRILLTVTMLFPAGLMMGFQFPSLIRMASSSALGPQGKDRGDNKTTLLWGINVIASIVGTVLAALMAMIVGFNGNLLIGLAMYVGAAGAAVLAFVGSRKYALRSLSLTENG
ncbi:MAG: hypothetical protein ACREBU_13355, partial [Nitrososphaera sp.]